jgi:hypothetical protein
MDILLPFFILFFVRVGYSFFHPFVGVEMELAT